MIEIKLKKGRCRKRVLEIEGHAHFDVLGKDIVCSGISALYYALRISGGYEFREETDAIGNIKTVVYAKKGKRLDMAMCGFRAIADAYPKNVKIIESETKKRVAK